MGIRILEGRARGGRKGERSFLSEASGALYSNTGRQGTVDSVHRYTSRTSRRFLLEHRKPADHAQTHVPGR